MLFLPEDPARIEWIVFWLVLPGIAGPAPTSYLIGAFCGFATSSNNRRFFQTGWYKTQGKGMRKEQSTQPHRAKTS
jgi:hypothetical protein